MAVIEPGRADKGLEDAIRKRLSGSDVHDVRLEIGHDSNGFPAVWVWLIVPDQVASDPRSSGLGVLAQSVENVVRQDGSYWPYIFFRSVSEEQAVHR